MKQSLDIIAKILTHSKHRIHFLNKNGDNGFYQGSQTFFQGIFDELEEVAIELQSGKRVYLEDELGDVFWDYLCFLEGLEQEGKISKEKVFERCLLKFSERIAPDGSSGGNWNEVKLQQKARLNAEQNNLNQY